MHVLFTQIWLILWLLVQDQSPAMPTVEKTPWRACYGAMVGMNKGHGYELESIGASMMAQYGDSLEMGASWVQSDKIEWGELRTVSGYVRGVVQDLFLLEGIAKVAEFLDANETRKVYQWGAGFRSGGVDVMAYTPDSSTYQTWGISARRDWEKYRVEIRWHETGDHEKAVFVDLTIWISKRGGSL